ncbi:MAG: glutamate--cysteine ligase [Stackebrandtia sp.]
MGDDVGIQEFTNADLMRYRHKLRQCLDALILLADGDHFDVERTLTGIELELSLVGEDGDPAMTNQEVLSHLAGHAVSNGDSVQDELGRFNLELNLGPRSVSGFGLESYEERLRLWLQDINDCARKEHSSVVMVGALPTVRREHAVVEVLSARPRYRLLNDQILSVRGEDICLDIKGAETLRTHTDSIAPESVNTSVQFHMQLTPEQFPRYWNAAQAMAGAQLATAANSPYVFGTQLWAETRIILFEQATDVRNGELRVQGVRPRAWFGERWVSSAMDLFEENLRYFVPLLPQCVREDPIETVNDGGVPHLGELRLHNGTIYRWNRPVYDVGPDGPHLRVENRVVPAGPTPIDICANMAFYLGLVSALAEEDMPVWTKMPFTVAEQNFLAAARHGIDAHQAWPGLGEIPARALVLDHLLPKAAEGLAAMNVATEVAERLLSIIAGRCRTGVNGAAWQVRCVGRLERRQGMSRTMALREMINRYAAHAATNTPVHEWPPD